MGWRSYSATTQKLHRNTQIKPGELLIGQKCTSMHEELHHEMNPGSAFQITQASFYRIQERYTTTIHLNHGK